MHYFFCVVIIVFGDLLFSSITAYAQAQELSSTFYVHASRLVVRTGPTSNASIKVLLPTNTQVLIKSRLDEWCEISSSGVDQQKISGFAACRFLEREKLRLHEVDLQLSSRALSGRARLDLLQQKFWISPSPDALMVYGGALDQEYPAKLTREEIPKRAARPEYEAMKKFLRDGWQPAQYEYVHKNIMLRSATGIHFSLPKVTPSLFGEHAPQLVLAPAIGRKNDKLHQQRDTVFMANSSKMVQEALFHQNLKIARMLSTTKPLSGSYGGYSAAWDIGGYTLQLNPQGVSIVGLSVTGDAIYNSISRVSTEQVRFEAECDQIGETMTLSGRVAQSYVSQGILGFIVEPDRNGITSVKRLSWNTSKVSASQAAKIYRALSNRKKEPGEYEYPRESRAFMTVFDLNSDGIADIAFEGLDGGLDSASLSTGPNIDRVFATYLNLGGNWMQHSFVTPLRCAS